MIKSPKETEWTRSVSDDLQEDGSAKNTETERHFEALVLGKFWDIIFFPSRTHVKTIYYVIMEVIVYQITKTKHFHVKNANLLIMEHFATRQTVKVCLMNE